MANIILTTGMFLQAGFYKIPQNSVNTPDLQAVILQWEQYYLYQLLTNNTPQYPLGLADLFVNECNANPIVGGGSGTPTSTRFTKIFNRFNEMDGDRMYSSKGMIDVFKSLIAYHYVTEIMASYVGTGAVTSGNSSGSKTLEISNAYRWAESRFNDALESVRSIKWWLYMGNGNGGGAVQYPEYLSPSYRGRAVFKAKYQDLL
jgi:hypothetical protein